MASTLEEQLAENRIFRPTQFTTVFRTRPSYRTTLVSREVGDLFVN